MQTDEGTMLKIVFSNPGGELDHREAESPVDAIEALIEMLMEAGELHDGDVISVKEMSP